MEDEFSLKPISFIEIKTYEDKYQTSLADNLAELAKIIRLADSYGQGEYFSKKAEFLSDVAKLSFRKLLQMLEIVAGVEEVEKFYFDMVMTLKYYTDFGYIEWCGNDDKAQRLAIQLEQWHKLYIMLTNDPDISVREINPEGTGFCDQKDCCSENPDDLIDLNRATEIFCISRSHLKKLIYDKQIKSYKKKSGGKHWISLKQVKHRLQVKSKFQ